jgi:ABC-type lipoprotein release transport system permease subunit
MGYNVYHFYGDQVSQGTTSLINLLLVLVLLGMMALVFRIIMGSYRALEVTKRRDYNIMRTVGLPNNFVKSIYYVEMLIQGVIGWVSGLVLTVIIGLIYGFVITPKASYGLQILGKYGLNLLWVAFVALAVDLFITYGNARRFNHYFYRQTVKMSLKEGTDND